MKRLSSNFSLMSMASIAAIATVVACGGISDPTKGSNIRVATVTGALTGTAVPSGTRVALVWRDVATNGYAVGSDVAVANGKFTMDLSTPPASYFFSPSSGAISISDGSDGDSVPPAIDDTPVEAPPRNSEKPSKAFDFANGIGARDTVSGQITQPLTMAAAGFVVYVDTNGNGKLDIEGRWASSTDEIIGGNKELLLTFLRDGGSLDYEKLRDRSGILPAAGYNLAWDQGRWLPLDAVELKIESNVKLPTLVCERVGSDESLAPRVPANDPDEGSNGYPSPGDPNLHCSEDGYSYTYTPPPAPVTETPVGLCAVDHFDGSGVGTSGGGGESYKAGSTLPEGWPCPVESLDGGAGPVDDGGAFEDAGAAPDAGE
jgi:hypothetical protein